MLLRLIGLICLIPIIPLVIIVLVIDKKIIIKNRKKTFLFQNK